MMRCKGTLRTLAALLISAMASGGHAQSSGSPDPGKVDTIKQVFAKLYSCWKPPPAATVNPMDITVVVSFNRAGQILGHPRITYESAGATDNDRLAYRVAVMEALQRCTPMPFTETMAGAAAGRPFAVQFRTHKPQTEKRAWLSPKIL
jgi:hypothetical protein